MLELQRSFPRCTEVETQNWALPDESVLFWNPRSMTTCWLHLAARETANGVFYCQWQKVLLKTGILIRRSEAWCWGRQSAVSVPKPQRREEIELSAAQRRRKSGLMVTSAGTDVAGSGVGWKEV